MVEFRWVTKALAGPWVVTRNQALMSAVDYGQALVNRGKGRIATLMPFATIEKRLTARAPAPKLSQPR